VGAFVFGEMLAREGDQFLGGNRVVFAQGYVGQDHFTPVAVGLTDDAGLRHCGC
jgi:hypothetical protein